jgi:hypothetical protein
VLFGRPERSFYASELIRTAGTGSGAAQREFARLETSGLVLARRIGHQKHYQANAASPLFGELRGIVLKTVGLAEALLRTVEVRIADRLEQLLLSLGGSPEVIEAQQSEGSSVG